jgi:Nucleotidyl transferase AbiEii toxin, Type IV TA system
LAERAETRRALALLACFDATLLRDAHCWFAGGTAVSLRCGEFRVSRDVDFLCASMEGYRTLRERARERGGRGLFARDVVVVREPRIDRYGIRMAVAVEGAPLKVEIVSEGRVTLRGEDDPTLPVARLTDVDLITEKLLANDDRYLDDSALGRDAIDLVMLEDTLGAIPTEAWEKARAAYGPSVERAWPAALRRLRDRPVLLARAFDEMRVSPEAKSRVEAKLAAIETDDDTA